MYHLFRSLYLHATSKEEYSVLLLGLDNAGKTTLLTQIKTLFNTTTSSSDPTLGATGDLPPSEAAGNTVPTVGQNVTTIDLPDMYIKIWDVGGQTSLRRLWTSYYKSCHAIVFVVDSSDLGELEREAEMLSPQTPGVRQWHTRRKSSYALGDEEHKTPITPSMVSGWDRGRFEECRAVLENVLGHEDTTGVPILVLANKQDREDAVEVVRIKEGFVRPVIEGKSGEMVRDSRVLPVSALKGTGVKESVEWVRSRVVWNKASRPPVMR